MPCPTNIQPLYIECPAHLQSAYNAPSQWFEAIAQVSFLKILVQPEEYVTTREGDAPRLIRSFARPQYPVKKRELVIVITLADDNFKLRQILEEIPASTIQPNMTEALPIRMIDYVKPDRVGFKTAIAANTNPCTTRIGFLEVDPGGGTSGTKTDRYSINGIRFSFRQMDLVI